MSKKRQSADGETDEEPRLYAQLLSFTDCADVKVLFRPLQYAELECVLYKDLSDPLGIALLTVSENPELFPGPLRELLSARPFRVMMQKPSVALFGHTALGAGASGESPGERLRAMLVGQDHPWAIWYSLRHSTGFSALGDAERRRLLAGHDAAIAEAAPDVRGVLLSSHGLHGAGHELVTGLSGKRLDALSTTVERLAHAGEHAAYVADSGPFFVGRAVWQGEDAALTKARW